MNRRIPWWLWLGGGAVLLFLVAPSLVVVMVSFSPNEYLEFPPRGVSLRWFKEFLAGSDGRWVKGLMLSLKAATLTALASCLLGSLAAYAVVRSRSRFSGLVVVAILSPLIVPTIILAVGLYGVFAKLRLVGTLAGLVIAHTGLALGYVYLVVSAALRDFNVTLEHAAMSLGATRAQTLRRVTLPLLAPAIVSSSLFAFITSFDELVLALYVGGTQYTLPRVMWEQVRYALTPTIAAVSTILMVLSALVLVGAELVRRRLRT